MRPLKFTYSDVGEGGVTVNCEKNTIFPEHPVEYPVHMSPHVRQLHLVHFSASIGALLETSSTASFRLHGKNDIIRGYFCHVIVKIAD